MPDLTASRRRNFNTRGRTTTATTTPRRRAVGEIGSYSEPPKKKRRYVPGGPGGGGRYVDAEGNETPVGGTGPGGYNYIGPRGRVGPMNAANGLQPPALERPERSGRERPRRESRREKPPVTRPRYSSAAAAAAAVVQGDGFKPREERGWEEFHEHLDIDLKLPVFSSGIIDGTIKPESPTTPSANGISIEGTAIENQDNGRAHSATADVPTPPDITMTPQPMKRRPGRPPRNSSAMLKGIGTPDTPKVIPLPGPNPREKLTLPKPSFRMVDPFVSYEKANGSIDYVDRTMANVGYQESDHFVRPDKGLIRLADLGLEEELDTTPTKEGETNSAIGATGVPRVEYDMDEQDQKWLETYNVWRKEEQTEGIKPAVFEITMTKIEKEWHALEKRIPKPNPKPPQTHRPRSSSAAAVNGEASGQGEEQDSKCAICDDGDCENTNAIVFCDGCDLAVHQECYGVPFIPEGQWLCRKCHLTGRGTPTCVFCPNTDGAFKQTNSARWSHLLCAIWIPEVSLGNTTFMEPVMDVEKVPKNRWKLVCQICHQKMGACIQCGHKSCFTAFHVTCGRRARWYLSMKSTQGGPANLEASVLKAYCGQHVPSEWRKTYNVDRATSAAKKYYKRTMRGKIWADSQQTAASLAAAQPVEPLAVSTMVEESTPKLTLTLGGNKRKKGANGRPVKTIWRLPSGAPVVPATLYNSVESFLQRFAVRKRREFAADMCRYWTLKREVKRGAALIKRLQLQMETFSSMEITRRDFAAMGAIGSVRLKRRIDFAESRIQEVDQLLELCSYVKDREAKKLQDAELLRNIVDTVYFPIPPLLWPILEKALQLDSKGTFHNGLNKIREKLEQRAYSSVAPFSADFGSAFAEVIGMSSVTDTSQVESQIMGDRTAKKELTADDKDKRKLARRIVRAVQAALEDANHKESELCRRPYEEELLDFEQILERSTLSRRISDASLVLRPSTRDADVVNSVEANNDTLLTNGVDHHEPDAMDITAEASTEETAETKDADATQQLETNLPANGPTPNEESSAIPDAANSSLKRPASPNQLTPASTAPLPTNGIVPMTSSDSSDQRPQQPPTPPLSTNSHSQLQAQPPAATAVPPKAPIRLPETPLSLGGVPWYLDSFDPHGTTIYEERWTGRDVARGMSEDLTDLSEGELDGLVDPAGDEMEIDGGNENGTKRRHGRISVGDYEVRRRVTRSRAGEEKKAEAEGKDEERDEGKETAKDKDKERTKAGKVKKRWRGFR